MTMDGEKRRPCCCQTNTENNVSHVDARSKQLTNDTHKEPEKPRSHTTMPIPITLQDRYRGSLLGLAIDGFASRLCELAGGKLN